MKTGALLLAAAALALAEDTAGIRKIIEDRVDVSKKSAGLVVGLVSEKGREVVAYPAQLNGDSVFEIGSISKVFTSTLLAGMVERGEVSLSDPVAKFLPSTVKVPSRNGKEITLGDLASQISGLPRLPNNMRPKDSRNPYADYTVERMYQFLSGYTLTRDIGVQYEYSNFGVGLLGHALALKAGTDYEALVIARIAKPLKMDSTRITLSPELKARLAPGHGEDGQPVGNWDLPTLAGAGALRSTVNDMLRFAAANLGLVETPLHAALEKTHAPRHSAGSPDMQIGLGWHILTKYGTDIVWHNGGTGGYRTFIGFDKKKRIGVVVLSNSANGIDDIGFHLLESQFPLAKFAVPKKAVVIDPKIFDAYLGRYDLGPDFVMTATRDGDRFFIQATGQQKLELFPESETEFFLTALDARVSFVKNEQGRVTKLVFHHNGHDTPGNKIE